MLVCYIDIALHVSTGKYLDFNDSLTGWTLHQIHAPCILSVCCKVKNALALAFDVE